MFGKFTSHTSDQQQCHSQKGYRCCDFDTNEFIAVDTRANAQIEGFGSLFMLLFDDSVRRSDVSESETVGRKIARWMTLAHKMRLNQNAKTVLLFWKTNKMCHHLKQLARRFSSITSTFFSSEQTFSHAVSVVSKSRACLCNETIKVLIEFQSRNRFRQKLSEKPML